VKLDATERLADISRLRRPALVWVFRHPRVLLLTVAHVVVDAILGASVVALFFVAPVLGFLAILPVGYALAFAAALTDAAMIVSVRDSATAGHVSLSNALSGAWDHRRPLAAWAFDLLFVGLAIRVGSALFGRFGRVVGWTAEIAWIVVALLVVPAIVIGDAGMPGGYDYSRQSLRQTFGSRVGGVVGLTLINIVLTIGFAGLLIVALVADSGLLFAIWLVCTVAALVGYAFVYDAAVAVLGYAIYAHTAGSPLPSGFRDSTIRGAFTGAREPD
jgi:hypothetical protein